MSAVLTSNVKVCFEALIIKTSKRSHIKETNRVTKNSQSFSLLHIIFCKIQILLYLAEVNFVMNRCYSVVCGECVLDYAAFTS